MFKAGDSVLIQGFEKGTVKGAYGFSIFNPMYVVEISFSAGEILFKICHESDLSPDCKPLPAAFVELFI